MFNHINPDSAVFTSNGNVVITFSITRSLASNQRIDIERKLFYNGIELSTTDIGHPISNGSRKYTINDTVNLNDFPVGLKAQYKAYIYTDTEITAISQKYSVYLSYAPAITEYSLTALSQQMFNDFYAFIKRSTGNSNGIKQIITSDYLVLIGDFLRGYTTELSSSVESMALMLRGTASAYMADRDPDKLNLARNLMNALCIYFFKSRPGTSVWNYASLVNAGDPFNVRGPLASNGSLFSGGYIGIPVTFTNGIGLLNPAPKLVYQVVTNGSQFVYQNVYSDIANGTFVELDYYIDDSNNKIFGIQKNGLYGQPSLPNSLEAVGTIKLKNSLTGTYLVNYSSKVSNNFIAKGEAFEAWPMLRHLDVNEKAMSTPAMHYLLDAFRILKRVDSANIEWAIAFDRLLETFQQACNQESNSLFIFKKGPGLYDNYPLTYAKAYGIKTDGSAWSEGPPSNRYSVSRTSDGYVTFDLPLMDGQNGRETRYGVFFECQNLYLQTNSNSVIDIDVKINSSEVTRILFDIKNETALYRAIIAYSNTDVDSKLIPIKSFVKYNGYYWTADREIYVFGSYVNSEFVNVPNEFNSLTLAKRVTINGNYEGFSIHKNQAFPFAEWEVAPGICYKANSSDMIYSFTDFYDWQWQCPMPQHTSMSYWIPDPSLFQRNIYVTGIGPLPSAPALGSGLPVKNIIVQYASGAPVFPQVIDVAYVSDAIATPITDVANIQAFTITFNSQKASVFKVGNVSLTNGSRKLLKYYGALPFTLNINGPSRNTISSAPFRGPYIAGYQSGTPWTDLKDVTKLNNMLDFMLESQNQAKLRSPTNTYGLFMHCYLPATWDSQQTGPIDTWVYEAPDGFPTWESWQYRAFDSMASTWLACNEQYLFASADKAKIIVNGFADWLYNWLQANPNANYLPSSFVPNSIIDGAPLLPNTQIVASGTRIDTHDIALALKGIIKAGLAGADFKACRAIARRLMVMLRDAQITDETSSYKGSFNAPHGFMQGEILDALALAVRFPNSI